MFLYAYLFSILSLFGTSTTHIPCEPTEPASLYVSTDKGQSWSSFAKGLPNDLMVRDVIEHDGAIYLSALSKGVYILDKGAEAWRNSSAGLPLEGDRDFFPTSMAALGDRLIIGTYDNGAYHSSDGGKSWIEATTNIDDVVGALVFTDDILLAGTHKGIWESKDRGVNWELRCETGFRINALAVHNDQLHVARQNGMGILNGSDIEWANMTTDWAIIKLQVHKDKLYAITAKNEVYRSTTGKIWTNNKFAIKGLPATNLSEALWNGLSPNLSEESPAGLVTETSRGWIVGLGGGC